MPPTVTNTAIGSHEAGLKSGAGSAGNCEIMRPTHMPHVEFFHGLERKESRPLKLRQTTPRAAGTESPHSAKICRVALLHVSIHARTARATVKLANGEICREGISSLLGALEIVRAVGAYWMIAIDFGTTTVWGEHVCPRRCCCCGVISRSRLQPSGWCLYSVRRANARNSPSNRPGAAASSDRR
jgi:hypothetical protein